MCVWTQEEFRSVIRFLWAKGTAPIEIHREIQAVYGPDVMTVQHVRKWCREFSDGRVSVTDEHKYMYMYIGDNAPSGIKGC